MTTPNQALERVEPMPLARPVRQALVTIEATPLETGLVPTGSDVPLNSQQFRAAEVSAVLMSAYLKAGTLAMTPEEVKKLTADFPKSSFERRENRFVYIPHIHISKRLTEVFGPGQWTMIRRREWIVGNQVNAEWVMIIRGHFIGESIGSQEYHPSNARQNFADVLEGTRGECIRRIAGKYLGCGGEAWDPAVAREMDAQKTRAMMQGGSRPQEISKGDASNLVQTTGGPVTGSARPQSGAASIKQATAATRTWMLDQLKDIHVKMQAMAIDRGFIMPDASLDDWPLTKCPTNKTELLALRKEIEAHV